MLNSSKRGERQLNRTLVILKGFLYSRKGTSAQGFWVLISYIGYSGRLWKLDDLNRLLRRSIICRTSPAVKVVSILLLPRSMSMPGEAKEFN